MNHPFFESRGKSVFCDPFPFGIGFSMCLIHKHLLKIYCYQKGTKIVIRDKEMSKLKPIQRVSWERQRR
jgi:hypothetical protein